MEQVALVTGGSGGIGGEICRALSKEGYHVLVGYRRGSRRAEEIATSCPGSAHPFHVDVQDVEVVQEAVDRAEAIGPVAVLVNAAGIAEDDLLLRTDPATWDRVMSSNLRGAYLASRAVIRPMLRRRWGRIVSVSSVVAERGNVGQTAYAASKAGLHGFTRALAQEVGRKQITVNVVAPGLVETEMTTHLPPDALAELRARTAIARPVGAEEVAAAVAFLTTTAAAGITGAVLPVDGGLS